MSEKRLVEFKIKQRRKAVIDVINCSLSYEQKKEYKESMIIPTDSIKKLYTKNEAVCLETIFSGDILYLDQSWDEVSSSVIDSPE